MKKFRELSEQHREEGKFKPTVPRKLSTKVVATPKVEESVADKLHQQHQAIRAANKRPHPDYYKELGKSYDINDDKERLSKQSEIKKKYKVESVEQIEEGRPSQRHPLEGHEYHKKSDEALIHIAKDAHAAAEAMKGHNTTAENKYRDQANDSATVRHYRKTHGMADWYKKKYGHTNEAVENKPPFDPPYTKQKSKGPVVDKSGAKHSGMSIARHLDFCFVMVS